MCLEKYVAGHKCKGKQIFTIEVSENDQNEAETELIPLAETYPNTISEGGVGDTPELSIHVISGTLSCSIMKVEGQVSNKKLQLLIDSESTHSFLDNTMTEKFGCRTEHFPPRVLVANINEMTCNRVCKKFKCSMQEQRFETSGFLVPLENY